MSVSILKQDYSIDKGKRTFAYQDLQKVQKNIKNNEKLGGWSSVIKGQHVTGVISEVNDQIVLNFNGKEVKVPKGLLQDPVIGEARLFEVLNVTDKIIEMREKNEKEEKESKDSDKASIIRLDKDPYTLLTLKQYTAMLMEKNKEYQDTKSKVEEIIVKMTEQDYLALQNEGFSVEDMSIDCLYAALKRVKEEVKPSQGYEQDQITSSKIISLTDITEKMIETKLSEANLPITKESVQRVSLALELSEAATKMNEQAVTYLIRQEIDPTIANIYKANYSGIDRQEKNLTLSEDAWSNLLPQMKEQIAAAGYEVNKETLKDAKWLVEKNLPLTIDNFVYYKDLENIKNDFNPDSILNKIVEGMKDGLDPKDTSLSLENTKKIENIIADIQSIHEDTIVNATKENSELTIQNLIQIQKNRQPEHSDKIEHTTKELPIEAVKAKRQLEEIRLKMTAEAALKLEKKGIHIETERLEKVVESLRELEDSYYRNLLCEAAVEPSQEHINILKETTQSMEQLKYSPSYILGRTLYQSNKETIPSLLSVGDHLKLGLEKANEAYETLMTIPNREYGDSIQKAFKNMASLLEEMNIENTIYNQRAVRILGYNSMDITKESIDQVKAYDMQVNTIIKNLHPAITVRLIKEGTNPLNIPIHELNKVIDKMKQEQGLTQEEKYSTYLQRLEREKGISEEERKAYIGIYRLLYQIDKTDGAALGAVVKADREVTLNNLLTAIRTSRVGSMDTIINDEFGTLKELNVKNETISEQLKAVFENSKNLSDRIELNTAKNENQIEYLHTMLKSMLEEVTPHKFSGILESYTGKPVDSLEVGLWNTLKDTSIEKLFDHFQKLDGVVDEEAYDYTQKVEELREVFKNSEQAIRFLNDLNLPCSSTNIMLAGQLLSNGGTLFKKLQKLQKENKEEKVEMPLKEITEFTDTIIDKKTINETYEKLEVQIEEALSSAFTSEQLDIKKLTDLNSIRMQINFAKRLADREFYQIPLATEEGVTNINLTIIRGSNHVGKVSVTVYSEFLGKIKSDFILKDKELKGFISCDNRFGLELIQKNTQFIDTMEAADISVKQIDFGVQQRQLDNYTYQKLEKENDENNIKNEKVLYQLAKNFINMIKEIEKSV